MKPEIRDKLKKGLIDEALEDLEKFFPCNEVFLLKTKYAIFKNSVIRGTITKEEQQVTIARITDNILTFLDKFEQPTLVKMVSPRKLFLFPFLALLLFLFLFSILTIREFNSSKNKDEPSLSEGSKSMKSDLKDESNVNQKKIKPSLNQPQIIKSNSFSFTFSGVVINNSTQEPISGVKVFIERDMAFDEYQTFTDSIGEFSLKIDFPDQFKSVKINFNKIGFKAKFRYFTIEDSFLEVQLKPT